MNDKQTYQQIAGPTVVGGDVPTVVLGSNHNVTTYVTDFASVKHLLSKKPLQRPRRSPRLPRI